MKDYFRIMLGRQSVYAKEARDGNFIGAGWLPEVDLSDGLVENWREFNQKYIPIYLSQNPGKSKIAAGLACGMLWTIVRGIEIGDIVLSPDGQGNYYVGEVIGGYEYKKSNALPHRRPVRWYTRPIPRNDLSEQLRHATGSIGTVSNVSRFADEIEQLIAGGRPAMIVATDDTIENVTSFALEEHLEEQLVKDWSSCELGKSYDIFEEDGEIVGQQYPSDSGPIDILAVSKDKKSLLVVELKKGRASDVVVGQILRYMGYVKDQIAEEGQEVRGVIIAHDDDFRVRRALSMVNGIDFYKYELKFRLFKQ